MLGQQSSCVISVLLVLSGLLSCRSYAQFDLPALRGQRENDGLGPIDPGDSEVRQLLMHRYNTAREIASIARVHEEMGTGVFDELLKAEREVVETALELVETSEQRLEAANRLLKVAEQALAMHRMRVELGAPSANAELLRSEMAVIDARQLVADATAMQLRPPVPAAEPSIGQNGPISDPFDVEETELDISVPSRRRIDPTDSQIRQLLTHRFNSAADLFHVVREQYLNGIEASVHLNSAARELYESELALARSQEQRLDAADRLLQVARHVYLVNQVRYELGVSTDFSPIGFPQAKLAVLDALLEIARIKAEGDDADGIEPPATPDTEVVIADPLQGLPDPDSFEPPDLPPRPVPPESDSDRRLLTERYNVAAQLLGIELGRFQQGAGLVSVVLSAAREVLTTERELACGRQEHGAAAEQFQRITDFVLASERKRVADGAAIHNVADLHLAEIAVIDAHLEQARIDVAADEELSCPEPAANAPPSCCRPSVMRCCPSTSRRMLSRHRRWRRSLRLRRCR